MTEVTIKTEYIKISQLLKLGNIISQGSDAKLLLSDGLVKLNGEVVYERGKKVYKGDIVEVAGYAAVHII